MKTASHVRSEASLLHHLQGTVETENRVCLLAVSFISAVAVVAILLLRSYLSAR